MGLQKGLLAGLAILIVLLTSCRSRPSQNAQSTARSPTGYEIACSNADECHGSVALLVGLSALREPTRCTAALIGPKIAVTAGHCVMPLLGARGECDGVWLGFPATPTVSGEWVACETVVSVASPKGTLLAPDYAVLRLEESTNRPFLALTDETLPAGEIVQMVSVTPDRFYDQVHRLHSRRCVVDGDPHVSRWAGMTPKPVRVLSSCPIREGNSGAPLLDHEGRMRGLVHAAGPPFFAFGVMTETDGISKARH